MRLVETLSQQNFKLHRPDHLTLVEVRVFFANWQKITSDCTVLDMVKGCTLEFATYPHHTYQPKEKIELQRLLDKGIIIPSDHEKCEFIVKHTKIRHSQQHCFYTSQRSYFIMLIYVHVNHTTSPFKLQ